MTKHEKQSVVPGGSDLANAAAALEAELRRFEQLGQLAQKISLNTERNLDKAAQATQDAAQSQERVAQHVGALIDAIGKARDRQQATAEGITERAGQIQARRAEFSEVLQSFASLGEDASAINAMVGQVPMPRGEAPGPEAVAEVVSKLQDIQARMGTVVERAQGLASMAEQREMVDIAQQADSLRQQIHASRNKLNLVLQRLSVKA